MMQTMRIFTTFKIAGCKILLKQVIVGKIMKTGLINILDFKIRIILGAVSGSLFLLYLFLSLRELQLMDFY